MAQMESETRQEQSEAMQEEAGPVSLEKLLVLTMAFYLFLVRACQPGPLLCMQELGIAAADVKKLREGGINTVDSLAHASKKELLAIKGISEAKVEKVQKEGVQAVQAVTHTTMVFCLLSSQNAAWKLVPMGFTTATIVAESRADIIQITTGCKELDTILEGSCFFKEKAYSTSLIRQNILTATLPF